ncbi:hypothetical protein [Parabacteroides distasonis]|uniref:hypothetical protein n=1 Tax=Parabacteroides distasonis TaxID=823 RepID=UPI000EFB7F97|nr:hypothetical protein [Parabacteroides distasonis]RHB90648.1 hypothetical protein DW867_08435 [Parabacteroides distasonis]
MNVHHNKIRKTALPRTGRALDAIGGGSITSYRIESGEGGGGASLIEIQEGKGISITKNDHIYEISHKDTSTANSIIKEKKKALAGIGLDDFGHVTGLDTCDILDLEDLDKRYLRKDINDEAAGEIIFDKKIGSSIFLDGMDGKGWEIKADGSGIMEALKVRSDIYAGNKIGSISFAPGFTGWGTEIDIPTATGTFDNIFVRKTFTAYEIVYSQIYGLGGNQIVSDINKIGRVERLSDRWRCYMDDMDGLMLMNLREGDGVRIQRRNGITSTKYIFGRCIGISSDYFDVAYPLIEGTGEPEAGDFAMRWGNDRDTTRQGLIYLTSADQGAPFIAVYDGITGVSTQDTLKAQIGNLSMIRTKNGTQLKGYGAYLNGIYIENSSIYLDNGMTVEQQFSVMNGELRSEIEGVRNDMSLESGNILVNSTFGKDTNYWRSENEVHFINVGGDLLWIGGAFYSEKREVADIYRDGERNVLRLLGTTIYQSNANMKGDKAAGTYSYAFFYKVMRRGVLTVGFAGQELYDSLTLDPSGEYVKLSKVGKWDGTGDFRIGFTGEILIYGVSLFNDRLADAVIKLETRILQTEEYIKLLATKEYVDSETGAIYTKYDAELSVMADKIEQRVTKTDFDTETGAIKSELEGKITVEAGRITSLSTSLDNTNNSLTQVGTELDAVKGNLELYVKKDGVISSINLSDEGILIQADRINLVGAVTFNMFNTDVKNTINNASSNASSALSKANEALSDASSAWSKASSAESTASTAYSNASKAIQDAATAISNAAKAVTTAGSAQEAVNSLPAWSKEASIIQALTSATVIVNGYVKTSMIDVDNLYATSLAAVRGTIGGFTIESNKLSSNMANGGTFSINPSGNITFQENSAKKVAIGTNVGISSFSSNTFIGIEDDGDNVSTYGLMIASQASVITGLGIYKNLKDSTGRRSVEIGIRHYDGDASWFYRASIKASHMPFSNHIDPGESYPVRWSATTGDFYVQQ